MRNALISITLNKMGRPKREMQLYTALSMLERNKQSSTTATAIMEYIPIRSCCNQEAIKKRARISVLLSRMIRDRIIQRKPHSPGQYATRKLNRNERRGRNI